jgi:hypothetical protein
MTTYEWHGTGFPKTYKFSSQDADELSALSVSQIEALTTDQIKALTTEELLYTGTINNFTFNDTLQSASVESEPQAASEPLTQREAKSIFQSYGLQGKIAFSSFMKIVREIESKHEIV